MPKNAATAMIKQFRVTNFKSLSDVTVELSPVTVLIGRSGSGKTNFVQAIRWLRDYLLHRNIEYASASLGNWTYILSATAKPPFLLSFSVTFSAPGFPEDFTYELQLQGKTDTPFSLVGERLQLGNRILFHQSHLKWETPPPLINPPALGGSVMLGALTGFPESTIAYLILTSGVGCYAFSDQVLCVANHKPNANGYQGLWDNASNFLTTFRQIITNLETWQTVREMTAALKFLKPNLAGIDLEQPGGGRLVVTLEFEGLRQSFSLDQESEGFRRLLACLLALYQTPAKQIVIFDEPEKGIYPAGLSLLAEEFQNHADRGRGQVILTTHSPQFSTISNRSKSESWNKRIRKSNRPHRLGTNTRCARAFFAAR